MKKLIILSFILVTALTFACSSGDAPPPNPKNQKTTANTTKTTPVKTELGKKVYMQNCMICHGRDGKMGASGAANLAESTLSLEEKMEVIKKGRKTMTGFENLGEEKIKAVTEYINKFSNN